MIFESKQLNSIAIALIMALGIGFATHYVMAGFTSWSTGQQAFTKTIPELSVTNAPSTANLQNLGNFGSYLQGTTASQWALAGVILISITFFAQMLQLYIQHGQFEHQSFETSFFQLLTLHNEIVSEIRDTEKGGDVSEGRRLFPVLCKRLKVIYDDSIETHEQDTEKFAIECYEDFYESHPDIMGHYFRNLYHVIKFVEDSKIDESDKKRYTSIVRAQLSVHEHIFLHYNGLSGYGEDKFKKLIEKYALLENMKRDLLLNEKHETAYKKGAFGDDAQFYPQFKSQT